MTSSIRRPHLFASLSRCISFKTPPSLHSSPPHLLHYKHQSIINPTNSLQYKYLTKRFISTTFIKMADDDAYAAFLKKQSAQSAAQEQEVTTTSDSSDSKFFPYLNKAKTFSPKRTGIASLSEHYYISDTDFPFIPVGLKADFSSLPSAEEFAELINVDPESVVRSTVEEWDPTEQYKEVVEGVKAEAKDGKVAVYAVDADVTRKGYFVLGVEEEGLVGVRTGSVES